MTNKEKYKQAFSVLHTSDTFSPEVELMAKAKKKFGIVRGIIAACAAVVSLGGMGITAYAANIGGIQTTIEVWINDIKKEVTINEEDIFDASYTDSRGEYHEAFGGGFILDSEDDVKAITEEEYRNAADVPRVDFFDDGDVVIYYHGQEKDITDQFDSNGICKTSISEPGGPTFNITVNRNGEVQVESTYFSGYTDEE